MADAHVRSAPNHLPRVVAVQGGVTLDAGHHTSACGCQLLFVKGSTPLRVEAGSLKDDAEDH